MAKRRGHDLATLIEIDERLGTRWLIERERRDRKLRWLRIKTVENFKKRMTNDDWNRWMSDLGVRIGGEGSS